MKTNFSNAKSKDPNPGTPPVGNLLKNTDQKTLPSMTLKLNLKEKKEKTKEDSKMNGFLSSRKKYSTPTSFYLN
jgi:hypothetical protein